MFLNGRKKYELAIVLCILFFVAVVVFILEFVSRRKEREALRLPKDFF